MVQLRNLMSKHTVQYAFILIGILSISLLAIQPFTLNQIPDAADSLLQLHRTVAADYSLKFDHPLWIRYSTGVVYGYGAPIFNYFPPLSYYPGSWLHTLGLTFIQSWLTMMMIYTVAAAAGMFLLGRIWTQSNVGGWVAAVAYIYAPYFLFDSVARGISSEVAAFSVLPFVFYGFTRLAFYGRRRDLIFSVVLYAIFIPLHTLITLHGTMVLALYCLFLWRTSDDKLRTFLRLLLAGGLGLMMTAFFWLPAILETDAVKVSLIADQLDHIDVTRYLGSIGEILTLPHTADPTQMAQPVPITLSVVQLILSVFGLVIAWNDRNKLFKNLLLTLWGMLLFLIFLNTPTSIWIWENVPLIGFTQFPWRLLGLASLLLALMTGISVWLSWMIIPSGWIKLAVFSVLTLIIVSYSIPWTYSLYLDDFELNNIRNVHEFERKSNQLTLSSYSEYLPVSTDESQLAPNRLIERFEQNDIIPRLLESDTVEIASADWTSTSGRLQLNSSEAQTLIFDWLYIDGWVAEIDGQSVAVNPSSSAGLVAVDIPAGEFEMRISLQPTSIQSVSVVISIIGVLGVIGVALIWRYVSGFSNLDSLQLDFEYQIFAIVVVIGIGVFLFKAIILDHSNTQFKSSRFGDLSSENVEIVPLANFGNQIDLIDVEAPQGEINNRFLEIKLYWMLHEGAIETDYSSIIRMRNAQGLVIAEASSFQPGDLATSNWTSGRYIEDVTAFEIPVFTQPALTSAYSFDVALYDANSLENLSVINDTGNPVGASYELSSIGIDHRKQNLREERLRDYDILGQIVDADIGLYNAVDMFDFPSSVTVGDELIFDLTWQKISGQSSINDERFFSLVWIDSKNDLQIESELQSVAINYPFGYWIVREVIEGHYRVFVPADLPDGVYQLGIQLYDEERLPVGDLFMFDQEMSISVPDRVLVEPDHDHPMSIQWGNGIELQGYDLTSAGKVRLIWKTSQPIKQNLRMFVQIVDADDLMLGIWDGIPMDWTRPTTGWIPEEYVTTEHQFDLPAGDYRVRVGWYDPISGDNVAVDNADFVYLDELLSID